MADGAAGAAPLLLLALNVLLFFVLCAGVGALGASSAFAESMVTGYSSGHTRPVMLLSEFFFLVENTMFYY